MGADVEIKIGSAADNKGIKDAQKAVQDLNAETKKLQKEAGDAAGKNGLGKLVDAAKQIKTAYEEAGGGTKGFLAAITTGSGKAAAGVAALTAALTGAAKAVEDFADREVEIRRLDQALANQGLLVDSVREKYQNLAQTLQSKTAISADSWLETIRQLTQAGSTPETMERDINAVKSLVGIYGTAEQAAVAWGKALHGQFDILREHGIIVDQNATQAEKLNEAYEEIVKRGGGQLEAQLNTITGQWDLFKLGIKSVLIEVGSLISQTGIVQYTLHGLGETLLWVAKLLHVTVPPFEEMRNAMKKASKSAEEGRVYNIAYADSLQDIERYAKAVNEALDRGQKIKEQARRQEDEQTDAKMALDLAIVDRLEKTGSISPEQAIQSRATIRERSASEKFQRDRQARVGSMQNLQNQIDSKMDEIAQAEEAARAAEAQVNAEKDADRARRQITTKADSEVARWEQDYRALHASPWDYSNPELGERAGPRTEADMARVAAKITARINAAKGARDSALATVDKNYPPAIPGSKDRALQARALATEITQRNYGQMNELASQIESLGGEQKALDVRERYRVKTAAITAGTEVYGANPNVDTRGVEANVMRSSQALQGKFDNLGSVISGGFETMGAALQDVMIRVKRAEDQIKRQRN